MIGLPSGKVFLVPWSDVWEKEYIHEKERILEKIGNYVIHCYHIGSTAVKDMSAKPVIDIAVEVPDFEAGYRCTGGLAQIGYRHRILDELPGRHYFSKGEPRTHQIHMYGRGSIYLEKQIAFRDFLRENGSCRDRYRLLKEKLAEQYRTDKLKYADAKTEFINDVLKGLGF